MPNPHHRKKHKHFQPPPHTRKKTKGGAASIMAVFGALVGLAIIYFAVGGTIAWLIAGTVGGMLAGYIIGKNMDKAAEKGK